MLGIEEEFSDIPLGKYRNIKMKQRVGQYFFRTAILNSYANRCCITGINEPKLLIASHIKPWKSVMKKLNVQIREMDCV